MERIELHRVGYASPSQANWSYRIWNCYGKNGRVQCKETFGGDYRLKEQLEEAGYEVKVYQSMQLGKFGVRETEKMPDIESPEVFVLLTRKD